MSLSNNTTRNSNVNDEFREPIYNWLCNCEPNWLCDCEPHKDHEAFKEKKSIGELLELEEVDETGQDGIKLQLKWFKNDICFHHCNDYNKKKFPANLIGKYNVICSIDISENICKLRKGSICTITKGTTTCSRVIGDPGFLVATNSEMDTLLMDMDGLPKVHLFYFQNEISIKNRVVSSHMKFDYHDERNVTMPIWKRRCFGEIRTFCKRAAVEIHCAQKTATKKRKKDSPECTGVEGKEFYHENPCSWLGKYKKLPVDVTRIIRQYLSPPPFLFFEKGDLLITLGSRISISHGFVLRRVQDINSS